MGKINQILCGVGIDSMCSQEPTNTAPKEDIEESKIQYEISVCGVTMQIPITDKTSESSFLVSKYQGDEELDKITPPRDFEQKFSSVRIYDADGIHDANGEALAVNRGYFARAWNPLSKDYREAYEYTRFNDPNPVDRMDHEIHAGLSFERYPSKLEAALQNIDPKNNQPSIKQEAWLTTYNYGINTGGGGTLSISMNVADNSIHRVQLQSALYTVTAGTSMWYCDQGTLTDKGLITFLGRVFESAKKLVPEK